MSDLSNYLEDEIIDFFLRNDANTFTPATTLYLAIYSTDPTDADAGTEASGGSYARQTVAFDAASGGVTQNSATVTFTDMPGGTFTHFGVHDALTAGNLLFYGTLNASTVVTAGDNLEAAAGSITLTMD